MVVSLAWLPILFPSMVTLTLTLTPTLTLTRTLTRTRTLALVRTLTRTLVPTLTLVRALTLTRRGALRCAQRDPRDLVLSARQSQEDLGPQVKRPAAAAAAAAAATRGRAAWGGAMGANRRGDAVGERRPWIFGGRWHVARGHRGRRS